MNTSAFCRTSLSLRRLLHAALLSFACIAAHAQAASADYTNDLPSVEKVKAQIKGPDPTDTLARQVAVFEYLQTYIQRIKLTRDYRGPYTAGETRLLTDYARAQYDLTQAFTRTHTPSELTAFNRLEGQYSLNNALGWIKQLEGKGAADTYKGTEASLAASQERFNAQIKKDLAPVASKTNAQGLSNDPTAVATRRCLELGGDSTGCMGKGFGSGLMDMITGGEGFEGLTGPGRAGVILIGNYRSIGSLPTVNFSSVNASIVNCGKLVDDNRLYTIRKSGAAVQLVLTNTPNPITLNMRSDGSLVGPGLVTVTGQILKGHEVVTHYVNGVASGTTSTPIYEPATDRCSIATLTPPAPVRQSTTAAPASDGGLLGGLAGMMGTIAPPDVDGLRLIGKYSSSSGLLLDFGGDAVTLDCGQAHVKAPYKVENAPAQFLVNVHNAGGPFTLAVAADNTLRGAGATAVNGRLVSGMQGENVTFIPHSENCDVGTFAPKSGSGSTAVISGGPAPASAPAPAVPVASAAVRPATAASPLAPTGSSNLSLAISSTFPTAKNPLAGLNVALMSERYDIALRKVGVVIPADVTPGKALQGYMANCGPPKSCPPLATAMHPYFVGKGVFDGNGNVTVSAPLAPGTYYVFCSAAGTKGALVWDVPVTLKPGGGNTVTLTATNAELVQ